jgi:hypothetical protein
MFFEVLGNLNKLNEADVCLDFCVRYCKVSCICIEPEVTRAQTKEAVSAETIMLVRTEY